MELSPVPSSLPLAAEAEAELSPAVVPMATSARAPRYQPRPGKQMTRFTAYLALYKASNAAFDDRQTRAMRFLTDEVDRRLDFILSTEVRAINLSNRKQVLGAPWLFFTGEFPFEFTEQEARNLREFLELGGRLWVDDCTTVTDTAFDEKFHEQVHLILPDAKFKELPMSHPIFTSCYDLRKGYLGYEIPPGDKYRENRLHAYFIDGRPAILYSRNDYGCGLEIDTKTFVPVQRSLTDLSAAEMQNGSVMMSMNLVYFFLGEQGIQGLTTRVAEAAAKDSVKRAEHQLRYHRLFVKGAIQPPFEDFESETAEEWLPIDEGQVTESSWNDIDLASSRIVEDADGKHLELTYPLKRGKTAFERTFEEPVSFADYHGLLADIDNKSPALVRVAIAIVTMPGWRYFESQPAFIKPGRNRNVLFHFFTKGFKSEDTDWEYRAGIDGLDSVKKIIFLPYSIKPGRLTFDNLRFSRVRAEHVQELLMGSDGDR